METSSDRIGFRSAEFVPQLGEALDTEPHLSEGTSVAQAELA
jgi:hypothetical protein